MVSTWTQSAKEAEIREKEDKHYSMSKKELAYIVASGLPPSLPCTYLITTPSTPEDSWPEGTVQCKK